MPGPCMHTHRTNRHAQGGRIGRGFLGQALTCQCHCELVLTQVRTWLGRTLTSDKAIRTDVPLYLSSIRSSQQDSLLYTQFSRTHPSSILSSIHCGTHLSLYLNISMCDLVLKDLLRRI
jgi:hypothetical protein